MKLFSLQLIIFSFFLGLIELSSWIALTKFSKTYQATKETNCSSLEFDPFLGHRHVIDKLCNEEYIKNAKLINKHWLLHTEDQDILNSKIPLEIVKQKDSFIIVTLGGSTTDGFFTNYSGGKTWPYLLSKRCQKKINKSCVVINGGVGSYSTNQEFLKLLIYFSELDIKPNHIISLSGVNEKPYFSYAYTNNKRKNNPYINLNISLLEKNKKYPELSIKQSRFYTLSLIKYLSSKTKNRFNSVSRREDNYKNNEFKYASENFKNNSILINTLSEEIFDTKFTHFLQPAMLGMGYPEPPKNSSDFKIWNNNLVNRKGHKEGMEKLYFYLKKDCSSLKWCSDISQKLPPLGDIYSDSTHPNAKGNQLISEIIAEEIFRF